MIYKIIIKASAEKELKKLPTAVQDKLLDQIESLSQNPRPQGVKKLKAFTLPGLSFDSYYRVRVGNYRIVYSIEDEIITVTIVKIGNRNQIYE